MLPKPFMTKASDSVWYVNPETESGTEFFTREQMLEQRRIGRLEALEEAAKLPERQPCKRCGRVHTEPPMTTERALALAAKPLAEQIEADIYAAAIRNP